MYTYIQEDWTEIDSEKVTPPPAVCHTTDQRDADRLDAMILWLWVHVDTLCFSVCLLAELELTFNTWMKSHRVNFDTHLNVISHGITLWWEYQHLFRQYMSSILGPKKSDMEHKFKVEDNLKFFICEILYIVDSNYIYSLSPCPVYLLTVSTLFFTDPFTHFCSTFLFCCCTCRSG